MPEPKVDVRILTDYEAGKEREIERKLEEIRIVTPQEMIDDLGIRILPVPSQEDDLPDVIRILDNPEFSNGIEIGIEPAMRLMVSAVTNQLRAQDTFFPNLRQKMGDLLPGWSGYQNPEGREWFSNDDLITLADRWAIPLGLVLVHDNHWNLMLEPPIQELNRDSGRWRWKVLVYNPWHQEGAGENEYVYLNDDFKGDVVDGFDLMRANIYINRLAFEQLRDGDYKLSLYGDREIADNHDVYRAKTTNLQPSWDGSNCGPACLMMAAMREGVKEGWNAFKDSGRDRLYQDIGLKIMAREEILR